MNDSSNITFTTTHLLTISSDTLLRKILLGSLLTSLSIFTVCGNLLVLYALRTEKRLRTVSNLFILSLALADLIVGLIVMPLSAANIIAGRWPFSYLICQMWLSIDYVASTASIFNLVLLSLDRYWAVVHPLLYLRNRTRKRATNFIVTVWFLSFLWAPAVIFWSYIVPEHSDIIKPNECDTAFRSNKIFKTLTALGNFYLPLLTMIIISCRIMVAIRSRSTMEFGRRISTSTQRQMKQDRMNTTVSLLRHKKEEPTVLLRARQSSTDDSDPQSATIAAIINPFETTTTQQNIPEIQGNENSDTSLQQSQSRNEDNESLSQYKLKKNRPTEFRRFQFPSFKPIANLFPSLSSIKENEKRNSEDLSKAVSENSAIRNSLSVSTNMKYDERPSTCSFLRSDPVTRKLSTSSFCSDEYPQRVFINLLERGNRSITENEPNLSLTTPSSPSATQLENATFLSANNTHLTVPTTMVVGPEQTPKMNILTFLDYIINPSLSSSLQKELKAARQLGMLVGVFTVSWLPYFILFLVVAWCQSCVSDTVYTASIWLGYINSTLNPLIYPLCNVHFRRAFKKTVYCQHAKSKLPTLGTLRELRNSNSMHQRR